MMDSYLVYWLPHLINERIDREPWIIVILDFQFVHNKTSSLSVKLQEKRG